MEAMRSMVEMVAELTALSVLRAPRGAPGSSYQGPGAQELMALRDRTEETLRSVGTPEPRVQAIRTTFSDAIMRDLESVLWRAVQRKIGGAASPARLREVRQALMRRLGASRPGEAVKTLRPYLEEVSGWSKEVETRLGQIDEFRRTGRLPSAAEQGTPREGARSGG
jgi:hypothetical protein